MSDEEKTASLENLVEELQSAKARTRSWLGGQEMEDVGCLAANTNT